MSAAPSGFSTLRSSTRFTSKRPLKMFRLPVRERVIAKPTSKSTHWRRRRPFPAKIPCLNPCPRSMRSPGARRKCPAPPLAKSGGCMIYEQRPHICRIFGPTIRGPRRAVRLEGCGYFKKDIPEEDYPIFDHYEQEKEMQRAMFRKAGRKRLRPGGHDHSRGARARPEKVAVI